MFVKLAQLAPPSEHVKKDILLKAIQEEQEELAKYESVNDNRSVFAN